MPNQTIESAKNHPVFKNVLNAMITNRFYSEVGIEGKNEIIKIDDLDKAIWLTSIIASSENEDDKYLSSVFGIALFLENFEEKYKKAAYIILSRSGNLIASRFFKKLIKINSTNNVNYLTFSENFGTIIDYELGTKLALNEINHGEGKIIGSDYQKKLWNVLTKTTDNVAISAPTSAGKSFIIQNYIRKAFSDNEEFFVIYIVPTRALISQVSEDFKKILKDDVNISTAFIEQEDKVIEQFTSKELFILTPERTLKLIQYSYKNDVNPNLIFIDEIQNIENDGNRGFLFEYLLNEMELQCSKSRKIIAGPFLDKPNILFKRIFEEDSQDLQTMFSPVFQLKVSLKPSKKEGSILAYIYFKQELINSLEVPIDFDYKTEVNKNKFKTLIKLVLIFGQKSKNIIYFPRTDYAERFSNNLANSLAETNDNVFISDEILDLIDLIKEEIHPDYYLIDALKFKSAFHHGKLPEIIRGELEHLFSKGSLNNIVCTSTLMEGINLPAEKVFIPYPKKDTTRLSAFEFANIVGRAGRIRDALTGTVLCIENQDEEWAKEHFSDNPEKEILPAINKILSHPINEIISALKQPIDKKNKDLEFAMIFLKHKFLKGDNHLIEYLKNKNVEEEIINAIIDTITEKLDGISIPKELSQLNPSIDPELQDILYKKIKDEGVEEWVFHENNNFNRRWSKENRHSRSHKNTNLFGQLENILFKLDDIFNFNSEAYFKHKISRTVPHMVYYAVQWLDNKSMKELISQEINFYANIRKTIDKENKADINKKINEVTKVYSTIISYVLVKYLKLLADILEAFLNEEELEKHKLSISIPTMLELGTYNALVLFLISKGMSRSIAIKVHKLIPEEFQDNPTEWLLKQEKLDLSSAYNKYLKRKGFLLQEDVFDT